MRSDAKLIVALMFLLAACGGSGGGSTSAPIDASCSGASCSPEAEPPSPAPLRCDSPDAASCPQGYRCVDDPADECDPATGTDCGGVCVLGEELPGCGARQQSCPPGSVCVDTPNDGCDPGPDADCPGDCQPESTSGCDTDADCPAIPAVCNICADGSASCASARCEDGVCTVEAPTCPTPVTCGGVGGRACPDGFHCVDDPADACALESDNADCSGVCVPDAQRLHCAGITGATCPPGLICVDDPNDSCDANQGADCPGICEPGQSEECTSDADCARLPLPCPICPDGSEACPKQTCENGQCSVAFLSCPPAIVCGDNGIGCNPGEACVDDPADQCDPANGSNGCKGKCVAIDLPRACGKDANTICPPGYECASPDGVICEPDAAGNGCSGVCIPSTPRECSSDTECAQALGPCVPCPGGTFSCPRAECRNAQCAVVMDGCADPGFCGGIAGFPCPPGLTCVDNPNDECDPQRGGADCAGMCVREEKPPVCGGLPGAACPPGYECADDPNDDCDPATGADCRGTCRAVSPPLCNGDADCFIGAPCRICPDGTAACPTATCTNGACQVQFGSCGEK